MRKVLLYYPKVTGNDDSQPLYRGLPLSVLTLAAQLDEETYQIEVMDGRLEKENDIISRVGRSIDQEVVCVGISAITSYQILDGLKVAGAVRELNPKIPIVWGGWHPSLMPEQTINHELIDIVVTGSGEVTFPRLVGKLAGHESLSDIPNLLYKDQSKEVFHTHKEFFNGVEGVKPIENSYRYVDLNHYIQPLWGNQRVLGYESSRGCPWSCKFCSIGSVYNRRWMGLPAEQVFSGIKHLYTSYHIDAVHFFDNNFFVDHQRTQKFSELMKENHLPLRWDGTAVVEQFVAFPDAYIESLMESGFYRVIVGVESGDEEVIRKINKRHDNKQVLELIEKCRRLGIMASLSFMVGFPWAPEQDFEKTIQLIEKIKSIAPNTEILLFNFSPYLGTPLFEIAREYGMSFPVTLEGWSGYTYEHSNVPWISGKLVKKINRYLSFFGTKDMPAELTQFLRSETK